MGKTSYSTLHTERKPQRDPQHWALGTGQWAMDHGPWAMGHGPWAMGHERWEQAVC